MHASGVELHLPAKGVSLVFKAEELDSVQLCWNIHPTHPSNPQYNQSFIKVYFNAKNEAVILNSQAYFPNPHKKKKSFLRRGHFLHRPLQATAFMLVSYNLIRLMECQPRYLLRLQIIASPGWLRQGENCPRSSVPSRNHFKSQRGM